jgi:hypothetical protein
MLSVLVASGTLTVVFRGDDVFGGRPRTLGTASSAVQQHGVNLGFGDSELVRCQWPWWAGDRWARYMPDSLDGALAHFALDFGGVRVRSGNSTRRLSTGAAPLMVLTLGMNGLAA